MPATPTAPSRAHLNGHPHTPPSPPPLWAGETALRGGRSAGESSGVSREAGAPSASAFATGSTGQPAPQHSFTPSPPHPLTPSTPPPLHPDDEARILEDFLRANCSLHELAWRNGITIDQLIAWAESPETLRRVEALERIAERQAKAAATLARPVAIGGLDAHVRSHQYDEYHQLLKPCRETSALVLRQRESARRAASTLLRTAPRGTGVSPVPTPPTPSEKATTTNEVFGGRLASIDVSPDAEVGESTWRPEALRSLGSYNPGRARFRDSPSSSHGHKAADASAGPRNSTIAIPGSRQPSIGVVSAAITPRAPDISRRTPAPSNGRVRRTTGQSAEGHAHGAQGRDRPG